MDIKRVIVLLSVVCIIALCIVSGFCMYESILHVEDKVCFDMFLIGSQVNESVFFDDMSSGIMSIDRIQDNGYYEFIVTTDNGHTWDLVTTNNGTTLMYCSRIMSNRT